MDSILGEDSILEKPADDKGADLFAGAGSIPEKMAVGKRVDLGAAVCSPEEGGHSALRVPDSLLEAQELGQGPRQRISAGSNQSPARAPYKSTKQMKGGCTSDYEASLGSREQDS